ncbi:MAG TPA: MogA/MoaB family molybdenum cofactor biosynthesis protein [Acidimicrobiia bacterium]
MRAVVITVSDRVSTGKAEDRSGPAVAELLNGLGFETTVEVVPDGVESVEAALRVALASGVDLIITTGGTGMSPRDLTPEATRRVIEREAPGVAEAMRAATFGVNPHGMLSRGVCGIAGTTLVLNLPGSPAGARESLGVVGPALEHAVGLLGGRPTAH